MTAIRPATLEDAPALVDLNDQLGYPTTEADMIERLTPILPSEEHAMLVATDNGRPIAWIHVALEHGLEASRVAVLRGLIVDERHRSMGIGHELLEAGEDWARGCGCAAVIVRSRIAREGAHRFYRREGFEHVKTSHVFGKPLV